MGRGKIEVDVVSLRTGRTMNTQLKTIWGVAGNVTVINSTWLHYRKHPLVLVDTVSEWTILLNRQERLGFFFLLIRRRKGRAS